MKASDRRKLNWLHGDQFKAVRRGWYLGDEAFRKELVAAMSDRIGAEHYGEERRETAEARADRIVKEELWRLGWREQDLDKRRQDDPGKVRMARRLRTETTVTQAWIARRLEMGTKTYLAHLLYWQDRQKGK